MKLEPPADSVHVVLVHGTFARDAPWTHPASALCQSVRSELAGHTVRFHSPQWTGANSHSDRVKAGSELGRFVLDLLQVHPAPCFLIGHSHGGTVISQALRQSPELAEVIDGSVFLSTPFIQVRRKDYCQDLMSWVHGILSVAVYVVLIAVLAVIGTLLSLPSLVTSLAIVSCFVLHMCIVPSLMHAETMTDFRQRLSSNRSFFVFFAVASLLAQALAEVDVWSRWVPVARTMVTWGAGLISGGVAAWLVHKLCGPARGDPTEKPLRLEQAVAGAEEAFAIRNIRGDRALFIRGNSDEANAGLVWVQVAYRLWSIVISLPLRATEVIMNFTRWPAMWRSQTKSTRVVLGSVLLIGLGPTALAMVAVLVIVIWQVSLHAFGAADPFQLDRQFNSLVREHPTLQLLLKPGDVLNWLVWLYPALFAGVLIGALGLVTLGLAFGAWFVWTSPFLEVSIEPVPPGRWRLLQIKVPDSNQSWSPLTTPELAHAIYLSSEAQAATAKWIKSKCPDRMADVSPADQTGDAAMPQR